MEVWGRDIDSVVPHVQFVTMRSAYLASAVLLLLGSVGGLLMFQGIQLYTASRQWERTIATVTSLRLSDSYRYDRTYGETAHKYRCYVEYAYTVNGEDYDGNQASIFWRAGDNNLCYRLAQKRGHDEIPCYYDPANPARSLLDRTFHEFELCKIALVSATAFVGGAQLLAVVGLQFVGVILTALYCTWCGGTLVWGYAQATSKLVFYAILSLVVGILFLVAAVGMTVWSVKIGHDAMGGIGGADSRRKSSAVERFTEEDESSPLIP